LLRFAHFHWFAIPHFLPFAHGSGAPLTRSRISRLSPRSFTASRLTSSRFSHSWVHASRLSCRINRAVCSPRTRMHYTRSRILRLRTAAFSRLSVLPFALRLFWFSRFRARTFPFSRFHCLFGSACMPATPTHLAVLPLGFFICHGYTGSVLVVAHTHIRSPFWFSLRNVCLRILRGSIFTRIVGSHGYGCRFVLVYVYAVTALCTDLVYTFSLRAHTGLPLRLRSLLPVVTARCSHYAFTCAPFVCAPRSSFTRFAYARLVAVHAVTACGWVLA